MFNKLKKYLARKLLPYADITPPKCEITSLDVETVYAEVMEPNELLIPEAVYKKELIYRLGYALTDYIKFEVCEDPRLDNKRRCRASIRVVKER